MADSERNDRPSPDALLADAKRESRGRLKIFLGAAPGVGKTFAMLENARQRLTEGVDIAVGVVETHGRRETQALLAGLETVPLRHIDYRARSFREMDLDGLLKRRPKLALVDELAHTNVPGSRHVKRYQDVEELLEAGIDVHTTLNIQHLDSLNDVIERISGIKVRETLPDSVLQQADEIELVDLSPEDLLQRLREGKVYFPEQARAAIHHFFSLGNLTALRELALRHAAERVDAQMIHYMRAHAIPGPWPTRERLMVCIDERPLSARLVRTTRRAAERRQVPWVAVHVETHRDHALPEEAKDGISQALRLAEQLGAETAVLQGEDVAAEIAAFAQERNVTQIVVGRPRRRRWLGRLGRSVTDRILSEGGAFDVTVIGGAEQARGRARRVHRRRLRAEWLPYLLTTFGVIWATGLGYLISLWLPVANISLVYLLAVLLTAMRLGLAPSIFASFLSFLAFNFFFTAPRFSFMIADTENIFTIALFLLVAVITSNLASRVRAQVEATKLSARRTANLYDFSKKIAAAATQDDVLWAVVHHVAATLHGKSLILMPEGGLLHLRAGYPPEDRLDEKSAAAAEWAWANGRPAGRGSGTLPTSNWLFLPMRTARGPVGVLGVRIEGSDSVFSPEQTRLIDTLADQAAVAIERTTLVADIETARVATEAGRLRNALLSSLSHDLRTPLVSIMGASSSLLNLGDTLDTANRRELTQTIQDEAERLNRFVQNLLDMTRLGSGTLKPRADWTDLRDVVNAALERAGRLLGHRSVRVDIDPELPLLSLDSVLMEQVFFNLLDNAAKFAPRDSTITIWAHRRDDLALIEVCDQGPGIPESDRERVFDMFYRVEAADSQVAGTGLGLAICRGIVEAHGGTVMAAPGLHGCGTCIVLRLPVGSAPAVTPETEPGDS